jgi:glycosyltransferase involved in cell wall biosynthesis
MEVYGVDLTAQLMHEENYAGFTFEDGRGLIGDGTVFLHVSGPQVPRAMLLLGRRFVRNKRMIAHWFWELSQVPDDWRIGVPFVHEICVNTRFVADAVRPIAGGRPIHVVPYPLPLANGFPRPQACAAVGKADRPFTVLVIFNVESNFARKNPCAAVEAFRKAFGGDPSARLIVKYSDAFAWPEGFSLILQAVDGADNIVLNGDVLSASDMDALYREADVVLSLHRAEGFGLVVAEAMLRGLPVVATNWSGNTDFLTYETGMPIGYDLIRVDDPQGNYGEVGGLWADPYVEEAAAALQALRVDPAMRKRLGTTAAEEAARLFHPARYAAKVKKLLALSESCQRHTAEPNDRWRG